MGGVEGAVALTPALGLGHGPAGLRSQVGGPVVRLLGGPDPIDRLLPVGVAAVEGVAACDEGGDGDEGDDGRAAPPCPSAITTTAKAVSRAIATAMAIRLKILTAPFSQPGRGWRAPGTGSGGGAEPAAPPIAG